MLSAHKLVPPALRMLLADPQVQVDGFILPGHVCVVTGTEAFAFPLREYQMPGVVTSAEPLDILRSLYRLSCQCGEDPKIENEYGRVVRPEAASAAWKILSQVYETADARWRVSGS